jgi:hypothetical protein
MEPFPGAKPCGSLSGTRLTGGRSGAQREAHAEDCLSGKPATVAGVREFRRQAGGAFSTGERRSTERASETVESHTGAKSQEIPVQFTVAKELQER